MVFQMEMEQIAESIVRIKKRIAVNRITQNLKYISDEAKKNRPFLMRDSD